MPILSAIAPILLTADSPTPVQGAYWLQLLGVLIITAVAASALVGAYGSGIRLWGAATVAAEHSDQSRSLLYRTGAVVCFAIAVSVILYGLYLVIPYFH
ncbi:MAG: hypothetical protein ABF811_06180 [Pseudoclavibacter sp.]|jgi:hypothetical protein